MYQLSSSTSDQQSSATGGVGITLGGLTKNTGISEEKLIYAGIAAAFLVGVYLVVKKK